MTIKERHWMRHQELNEGGIKANYDSEDNLWDIARLLKKTVIEYAKFNEDYRKQFKYLDFPMGWGELQNQGIMFHSIYRALAGKGAMFTEHPYGLNKEEKNYRNRRKALTTKRIDYWVKFNNLVLLVEYKHKCISVDQRHLNKGWDSMEGKKILNLGGINVSGHPKPAREGHFKTGHLR